MSTLRGEQLRCVRGDRTLFSGLDLKAQAGTLTVVIGPNGAGKSTLLRGLCGLTPLGGTVALDDVPLADIPTAARGTRVAFLPQSTPAGLGMTARDVVALGRLPHRSRWSGPSSLDVQRVNACLASMGVEELSERQVQTLSGGERQRVMLARLLATDAPVLVLDEPTAALDIGHALALLDRLRELAGTGHAIVLALHDVLLADRYADQVVCLHADSEARTTVGPPQDVLTPALLQQVFEVAFERGPGDRLSLCHPAAARKPR